VSEEQRAYTAAFACVLGWIAIGSMWRVILRSMNTSKLHLVLAAVLGALLPFVPDLVKLIPGLPSQASNAICAVVLACSYSIVPKQVPAGKADERGYTLRRTLFELCALACLIGIVACAALESAKSDPGKTARDVRKGALSACLACRVPGLPAEAAKACADLEPVCSALAGVCDPAPDGGAPAGGAPPGP
jgi:hypothetical protein